MGLPFAKSVQPALRLLGPVKLMVDATRMLQPVLPLLPPVKVRGVVGK